MSCKKNRNQSLTVLKSTKQQTLPLDSVPIWIKSLSGLSQSLSDFEIQAITYNTKLKNLLQNIRSSKEFDELVRINNDEQTQSFLSQSKDGKLTIVNWNTRLGGSQGEYKSLIFGKNTFGITIEELDVDKSIKYDSIFLLKDASEAPIYLLHGTGKTSNYDFFNRIDAIGVQNSQFVKRKIFPGNKSSWENPYRSGKSSGSWLETPTLNDEGLMLFENNSSKHGFAFKPYVFNGKKYEEKLYELDSIMIKEDFRKNLSGSHQMLRGSEVPISTSVTHNQDTFLFKDGLKVIDNYNEENEKSEITIYHSKLGEESTMDFNGHMNLVAKNTTYLFFMGYGVPESSPIYIYDLDQNKIVYSIYVADAIIRGNQLIFSQQIDNKRLEELDFSNCQDELQRFEILVLSFLDTSPMLQSTGQSYCTYVQ